jgi:prepilin-type N-terminal cleavage/methylation domain-containing protein
MLSRLRPDHGFTLIELLVSLSVGTVVLLGAFTLIDSAMPAANRISDRVAAQARGRTAVEQVVSELRSVVCVPMSGGASFKTPFDAVTNDTQMTFYVQTLGPVSGGTDPAIVNSFQPEKRILQVSAGKLVEQRTAGSLSGGNWTFTASPTSRQLLGDVSSYDATTPYFTYYAANSATPMPTPLSSTDWPRVARVRIALKAGPNRAGSDPKAAAQIKDSASIQLPVDYTDAASTAKGPQCA